LIKCGKNFKTKKRAAKTARFFVSGVSLFSR